MTSELQDTVDAVPDLIRESLAPFLNDSATRLQALDGACAMADAGTIRCYDERNRLRIRQKSANE
jgi:hypothetical protein